MSCRQSSAMHARTKSSGIRAERDDGGAPSKMLVRSISHATARTTNCPGISAREAPPANQIVKMRTQRQKIFRPWKQRWAIVVMARIVPTGLAQGRASARHSNGSKPFPSACCVGDAPTLGSRRGRLPETAAQSR